MLHEDMLFNEEGMANFLKASFKMKIKLSAILLTIALVVIMEIRLPVSSTDAAPRDYCDGFQNPPVPSLTQEPFLVHTYPHSDLFFPGLIADFDNDRDLDLPHLDGKGGFNFTFQRGVDQAIHAGGYANSAYVNLHGVATIDFDNDGLEDIIIAPYYAPGTPILLIHNLGNWQFELAHQDFLGSLLGFTQTSEWFSETIVVADLTGDGLNDIYIPFYTYTEPYQSVFLRNTGAGFIEEAMSRGIGIAGLSVEQRPEGAQAVDIDDDGDLDLYVAHHLFINDGNGYFTDAREAYGLPAVFDEGISFVDYNNDGLLDLYIRTMPVENQLFRNTGTGFISVGTSSGLSCLTYNLPYAWGDAWVDLDSDGDLDLIYITSDLIESSPRRRPTSSQYHLFLNQGDGTFRLGNITNRLIHLAATADFDNDGDLDVYGLDINGNSTISENIFTRPQNAQYLDVVPVDEQGKMNEQGAIVRVIDQCAPTYIQTRVIGANNVFLAQGDYPAHFALSSNCAYQVQVTFIRKGLQPKQVVTFTYTPALEGWQRILASRSTLVRQSYFNFKYFIQLPEILKNGSSGYLPVR
jgi:hypothetical protein